VPICSNCSNPIDAKTKFCPYCDAPVGGFPGYSKQVSLHESAMWACQKCGKNNRDDRTNCWHCGGGRDGKLPANTQVAGDVGGQPSKSYTSAHAQQSYSNPLPEGVEARALMSRYGDAYTVARVTVGFGDAIRIIGMVLAGVIVLLSLIAASQAGGGLSFLMFLMGLVFAAFVGVLFYLNGVIVSAQGQILKASVDGAVNSSFLTNEHRAKIMSLR